MPFGGLFSKKRNGDADSPPAGYAADAATPSYEDGPAASALMPKGVTGGGLGLPDVALAKAAGDTAPGVVSELPANYVTYSRPVPKNLEEFLPNPGAPRATATPDRFHPNGHPLTPPEGSRTSLQQHFDFFDINKDGKITLFEMITAFRYLLGLPEPIQTLAALPMALAVQLPLAWLTSDSWLPDVTLTIHTKNAHKVVHGSNSKAWTHQGHFIPSQFEAILSKYDKSGKGGLSLGEVLQFLRGQAALGDVMGIAASAGEWILTWWLLRDATGVLRREDIRGMYDGTALYRLAARNGNAQYGLNAREAAIKAGMS